MGRGNHYKAEMFIKAIPGTGGLISLIAKRADVNWHTAKKYIESHPKIKEIYDAECEGILDLAEGKLIEAVKGGDFPAIKFYLTTKGKGRGYTEKQEIEHTGSIESKLVVLPSKDE